MAINDIPVRILIVADQDINGSDLAATLEELGYQVCGRVFDSETCLHLAARERPDLIIMDMAHKEGQEALEPANLIRRQLDIPVVFVTARPDERPLRNGQAFLPCGHLLKPFQPQDVRLAVETTLHYSQIDRAYRQSETALKQCEEKLRVIIENPLNAMAVLQDNRIVFANKKLLTEVQALKLDHANLSYLDFVHPEDLARLLAYTAKHSSGQDVPEIVEFRLVTPDGSIFWIQGSGAMIDWQGQPAHLMCFRNISEQVAAREALLNSEEQHRKFLNQLPDPVLIFDRTTYHFLDCNQAAVQQYGYTREEFIQMTPFDLHSSEEHDLLRHNIDDETDDKPHHYTHLTKTGRKIQVETNTSACNFQGHPAWITIIRDITERLKSENLTAILYSILQAANLAADPEEYYRMITTRKSEN